MDVTTVPAAIVGGQRLPGARRRLQKQNGRLCSGQPTLFSHLRAEGKELQALVTGSKRLHCLGVGELSHGSVLPVWSGRQQAQASDTRGRFDKGHLQLVRASVPVAFSAPWQTVAVWRCTGMRKAQAGARLRGGGIKASDMAANRVQHPAVASEHGVAGSAGAERKAAGRNARQLV